MAEYKNQHTIQKAYLEGFQVKTLPDKWKKTKAIWVLSLKTTEIKLCPIKKVSVRPYYYSFIDKNNKMNPLIEKYFNPIEKNFIKVRYAIHDLITEINLSGKAYNLKPEYREIIAEYLRLHMIRVPKLFDQIKEKSKEFHSNLAKKGIIEYDENDAQVTSLRALLLVGNRSDADIVVALKQRNISIEFFPRTKVSIVTSDNPVIMYDTTRSPGLAYETTDVFFPIDASIFLKLWGRGDELRLVKHRDISYAENINYLIGRRAYEEIYSSDKETLLSIAKRMNIEL